MSFSEVAAQVFDLYGRGDYQRALAVVRGARSEYPEEDNDLILWEACLLSRTGRREDAVGALEGGLERGEWWPPGVLADEDLDPVRDLPGWEPILRRCTAIAEERMAYRPEPLIRVGSEPAGTLVAIQGAQGIPDEVASIWSDATPPEWTVVTPVPAEPAPSGGWAWPHSVEASAASVLRDLAPLSPAARPVVLTGFSIGNAIACQLIFAGSLAVDGLISVAPSSRSRFAEIRELARRSVPALVVCGGRDMRHDHYRELQADLANDAKVTVELLEDMGHEYPADLGRRVGRFLADLGDASAVSTERDR